MAFPRTRRRRDTEPMYLSGKHKHAVHFNDAEPRVRGSVMRCRTQFFGRSSQGRRGRIGVLTALQICSRSTAAFDAIGPSARQSFRACKTDSDSDGYWRLRLAEPNSWNRRIDDFSSYVRTSQSIVSHRMPLSLIARRF